MPLACFDGTVMDADQARLPVTDEGLLRGDGVFEVARLYSGVPFALDEHLARMERSAASLRLPLDIPAVQQDVDTLLAAAGPVDAALRLLVTRGGHRILLVEDLHPFSETIAVGAVTYAPNRVLDGVKSLSYAGNMLATRLARERGFDEAILVTPHGRVLEGPTCSLFWSPDGETLCTPPLSDRILDSITRRLLLELANAQERVTTVEELEGATEAFLASTLREVHPISLFEDARFEAPGPLSTAAALKVSEHVASVVGRSE